MTPFALHAAGEHVAVIAIGGDDLVAVFQRHLHADDDGFLPDIEMAEAADQTHAVKLAGLLFETADEQHFAIRGNFLRFAPRGSFRVLRCARNGFVGLFCFGCRGHFSFCSPVKFCLAQIVPLTPPRTRGIPDRCVCN